MRPRRRPGDGVDKSIRVPVPVPWLAAAEGVRMHVVYRGEGVEAKENKQKCCRAQHSASARGCRHTPALSPAVVSDYLMMSTPKTRLFTLSLLDYNKG